MSSADLGTLQSDLTHKIALSGMYCYSSSLQKRQMKLMEVNKIDLDHSGN